MKVPLKKEDEEKIFAIQKDFKQSTAIQSYSFRIYSYLEHIDELSDKLKGIVAVLTDCEQDLIKKIDEEVTCFEKLEL